MLVCFCGNNNDKNILLNKFKLEYKDKIVICNYFDIYFKTVIENEKIKYMLLNKFNDVNRSRNVFSEHINRLVKNKVDIFIKDNKDKLIVIITDNVLTEDIDKMCLFDSCDIKILVYGNAEFECFYDKDKFDYIIDVNKKFNIKKLVNYNE